MAAILRINCDASIDGHNIWCFTGLLTTAYGIHVDKHRIEERAKEIQTELWNGRRDLWPSKKVSPFDVLDPGAAAHILNVQYVELEEIGGDRFTFKGQRFRVAGLLDRQSQRIAVATSFGRDVVRFTGAHEIGHWVLHPDQVMHRDRALDGSGLPSGSRDFREKEADYFAACFLMPLRLILEAFKYRFGSADSFIVDDRVAFHLCPSDHESLLRVERDSLDREFALANCKSFNGNYFKSLSELFGVSRTAMAIRIKELRILRWP